MGDSSRRSRSRSRSPRRDRDRDHKDRDRKHRSDRRSGHDADRDRERERDRERDRDRHRDREHENKHKHHSDETEEERRERKRARRERERERMDRDERRERRRDKDRGKKRAGVEVVDDDGDMWVEKEIDAVSALGTIPTADSLPLKSTAASGAKSPPAVTTETTERREAWMLGPDEGGSGGTLAGDAPVRSAGGGDGDFFSSMGLERKRKDPNDKKPDPAKVVHSKYELNTQLLEGKQVDEYKTDEKKTTVAGGPGYQWRMMKLRRLYEQAEEQGRPVEDIAMERYGSLDEFNEALEERRVLDERDARRARRRESTHSSGMHTPDARGTPSRRFVFRDDSRPGSRQGFRRPGEEAGGASSSGAGGGHHTPGAGGRTPLGRVEALRSGPRGNANAGSKPQTPIPSVFTPQALTRGPSGEAPQLKDTRGEAVMTIEQLNRLQAKVLRAKLSDDPDAETLEDQYERERARFDEAGGVAAADAAADGLLRTAEDGTQTKIEVVPTLDGQGRMYDVGTGNQDAPVPRGANGRKKKDPKFETRDKQGNLLRYNADDDEVTLGELVRQERFGAGSADQKNLDAEFAAQIARDGRFSNDLEYMDDNADKLARKRMKTDAMKRAFAINDYQRTKRAMDECPFCFQDETGRPPLTAVVALGKRTYLCCTLTEELVPGHCLIVPIQHCLSTLELDDDDWDEIRNFMKCLMRMFAAENRGVLFYETILSHRQQRHTYIECVPLPADVFTDAPAYFRSSILASESEWSQHKKLIDFSARPGGFRRALVPNLPYFAVMWDYKGEKGYGHVIEGIEEAAGRGGDDDMGGMDEGDKGGGRFPPYFAAEIIGNVLDLEPRKWLRPKRIDYALNKERARGLGTQFQPYNWTVQLQEGA